MLGWLLINLSYAVKQYETYSYLTARMCTYQALTAWYIWDYFVNEPLLVYTWDIIVEHFGLLLAWGDYVFIRFFFSI